MELHLSTDDATLATSVYEFAKEQIHRVDGYASLAGKDRNGKFHHDVIIKRSKVGKKFPKTITFGQMLDMMKHAGANKIYFQREDWRGTHNCVALNNHNVGELYIDIFYEDNRYAKGFKQKYKENEVPIDCHPYIPTYADMFIHNWMIYGDNTEDYDYEEEANLDNCTV